MEANFPNVEAGTEPAMGNTDPIVALNSVQQRILDRLIEACLTGEECRTSDQGRRRWIAISPSGVGLLARHRIWPHAAEHIAQLGGVHPRAQERFLDLWSRVGWVLRGHVANDELYFPMMRKILPPYEGGAKTLYRGQVRSERAGPSWTRSPHIALKFALWGIDNVDPIRLALKGIPKGGREDAVVLKAEVPANHIICAPCLLGEAEGEYIIDPRSVEFTSEPARQAALWIKKDMERLFLRPVQLAR